MRYRSFGSSDLVVSEVGFGTWTLVTDWWGSTDHPHAARPGFCGNKGVGNLRAKGDEGAARDIP